MIKNIVIIPFSLIRPWIFKIKPELIEILNYHNRKKWFSYRANLFKKTLYRCLLHQTKKPEKIFVIMDTHDIDFYYEYLNLNNVIPIFDTEQNYIIRLKKILIEDNLYKNCTVSRIDSDDYINKEYFLHINLLLKQAEYKWINSCKGYVLKDNKIQSLIYNGSPFWTIYLDNSITIDQLLNTNDLNLWSVSHYERKLIPHLRNYNSEYIQFIHEGNLTNHLFYTNNCNKIITDPLIYVKAITEFNPAWFEHWAGFKYENPIAC